MSVKTSTDTDREDLTVIKGIGKATEAWLRATFDVRTVEDLARLSPERIEAKLKESGKPVVRSKIDEWLAQARGLLGSADTPVQPPAPSSALPSGRAAPVPERPPDWKPLASFVVEFESCAGEGGAQERRTTVHHVEIDETRTWPGIDVDGPSQWMSERVGGSARRRQPESPAAASPMRAAPAAAGPPVTIDLKEIRVLQPLNTAAPKVIGTSSEMRAALLEGREPLSFELSFELAGPEAPEIAKRHVACRTEVRAFNRTTGAESHLHDVRPVRTEEGKLSYTTTMPATILEPGTYRLECFARLEDTSGPPGFLRAPIVQVV